MRHKKHGDNMKCKLAKCNNEVPTGEWYVTGGLKSYCSPGHAKIGMRNGTAIANAKERGATIKLCVKENCSRMFFGDGDICGTCLVKGDRICRHENCSEIIDKGFKSVTVYCCVDCRKKQMSLNSKANYLKKISNKQLHYTVPEKPRKKVKEPFSVGKKYKDHRLHICNKGGVGPLCRHYSDCPQFVIKGKSSIAKLVMKYEVNGGIDCHEADDVNRVNYGDSISLCSINI